MTETAARDRLLTHILAERARWPTLFEVTGDGPIEHEPWIRARLDGAAAGRG